MSVSLLKSRKFQKGDEVRLKGAPLSFGIVLGRTVTDRVAVRWQNTVTGRPIPSFLALVEDDDELVGA